MSEMSKSVRRPRFAAIGFAIALAVLGGGPARATDFAWSFVENSSDGFGNQMSGTGYLTVTAGVVTHLSGTLSAYDGQIAQFLNTTPNLDTWSSLSVSALRDQNVLTSTSLSGYDNGLTATGPALSPTNDTSHLSSLATGGGLVIAATPNPGNDWVGIVDYINIYNLSSGNGVVDQADIYFQGAGYFLSSQARGQFILSFVPEPASMALLATGFAGLLAARRRRTA